MWRENDFVISAGRSLWTGLDPRGLYAGLQADAHELTQTLPTDRATTGLFAASTMELLAPRSTPWGELCCRRDDDVSEEREPR